MVTDYVSPGQVLDGRAVFDRWLDRWDCLSEGLPADYEITKMLRSVFAAMIEGAEVRKAVEDSRDELKTANSNLRHSEHRHAEEDLTVADAWRERTERLSSLFLAAVKEALPEEAASSVSVCYRYVSATSEELAIPADCVRVEIIRPMPKRI